MKTANNNEVKLPEHVSDEDLVSYLDGEIEGEFHESIRAHLEDCLKCSSCLKAFQHSIETFLAIRQENLLPKDLSPSDSALELFRERLVAHRTSVEAHSYFRFKIPNFRDVFQSLSATLGFTNYETQKPQLFASTGAGTEAGGLRRKTKSSFSGRQGFTVWNWKGAGIGFAAVTLLAATIIGTIFFTKQDLSSSQIISEISSPETKEIPLENNQLYESFTTDLRIEKTQSPVVEKANPVQRVVFQNRKSRQSNFSQKHNFKKPLRGSETEPVREFYPVTFAESMEEAKKDGHIISATLSRSSLFAFGVNLPVTSEIAKVKTELLVSSDGIVRGIRFVK